MNLPKLPPWAEAILRIIQFVSALVSLILWAIYLSNISGATSSLHAVLGIVVTGTVWACSTIATTAWKHRKTSQGISKWGKAAGLIITIVIVDFCFICLFAAVAGITGPSARGRGRACQAPGDDDDNDNNNNAPANFYAAGCGENKAVFGLAIVNVLSFSASSLMNAVQNAQGPPNPKSLAKGSAAVSTIKDSMA